MDPKPSLKLYATWASHFSQRVQLALKLKGLEYEYVEEDLLHKSPDLLHHNPIYKKVPVLVHDGHAIPESIVILHYIEETWPDRYPLLPTDPCGRAAVRFWCHFLADRMGPSAAAVFVAGEEGEQKLRSALKEFRTDAGFLEKELREGCFKDGRFFGGDRLGFLDIVLGCGSVGLLLLDEFAGEELLPREAFPRFRAWIDDFNGLDVVQGILPPRDPLREHIRVVRARHLGNGGKHA